MKKLSSSADRELGVNASTDPEAFDRLSNQRQCRLGGDVGAQFLHNKFDHTKLTLKLNFTWGCAVDLDGEL